jgi:hypothetical protein
MHPETDKEEGVGIGTLMQQERQEQERGEIYSFALLEN